MFCRIFIMMQICISLSYSQTAFRAVVKTVTGINTGGTVKTIESTATIAVKGACYRMQMITPSPGLYICNGIETAIINPATGSKQVIKSGALAGRSPAFPAYDRLKGMAGEIVVDSSWGLPPEIKKLKVIQNVSTEMPDKIELLDITGKVTGVFEITKTVKLSNGAFIPQTTLFSSTNAGSKITVLTCFSNFLEDAHMPDNLFLTNIR